MTKEETQMLAFKIIANAGAAIDYFHQAAELIRDDSKTRAIECLQAGRNYLNEVHAQQMELIQCEVNNESIPYTLLMTHAQDHLMNAISWEQMISIILET